MGQRYNKTKEYRMKSLTQKQEGACNDHASTQRTTL
jgi:hypothetical protein